MTSTETAIRQAACRKASAENHLAARSLINYSKGLRTILLLKSKKISIRNETVINVERDKSPNEVTH